MPKKNQSNYRDNVKVQSSLGSRILEGLTEAEISQLLDSLFAVLSDEQCQTAFVQLEADTHTTLIQIIAPSQTGEQAKTTKRQATSLAQTWSELWREWNEIITEASQSEGKYIVQEESWEEPYFDDCALVEDLEAVAQKMKPLVENLLTKDLTEIKYQGKSPYPKFYEVVILPNQLSTRDDISRRTYLQEYAPPDLWERVMAYWQANLHNFVPRPDSSQSSDYTKNAQWMFALKELAPQNYDSLLSQWKVQHKRRPNLWKAIRNLGLD